ncbi:hypothetical protein OL239_18705 [Arthrobacter sp. ATA002]|uniref:hypothetical protein n=1 Tax=Arthrobacter sp. ATA002 TaxID=2991715 RepID=UPI0022A69543|nr:hypothetical protein [Arthrobacter sp. ATA002]WAP51733.1 hypothetical protein OL239_18705 [Arthrobacter sp. ATA002]
MPSFRAQLNITGLKPGTLPEAVMETAVAALGASHHVEAHQLDIVGGIPRITLRFMVPDNEWTQENSQAKRAAANMRHAVEGIADAERLRVLRRQRGQWVPL